MTIELEKYRVEEPIGGTEKATVYRATALEVKPPFPVVVKAFRSFSKTRLLTAKRVRDHLRTPAIVKPLDTPVPPASDGQEFAFYIISEYIPNGNLRDRLEKGAFTPATSLYVTWLIAQALSEIYDQKVSNLPFHGNLHPGNVLFREDDRVALGDICIHNENPAKAALPYLSPEQIRVVLDPENASEEIDPRSDFFSLGTLLFEMLTGKKAFPVNDPDALTTLHQNSNVPKLPENLANLKSLVDRLLARNPADRFASIYEILDELDRLAKQYSGPEPRVPPITESPEPDSKTPEAPGPRPVRKFLIGVGLASAIAAISVLFFVTEPPAPQPGPTTQVETGGTSEEAPEIAKDIQPAPSESPTSDRGKEKEEGAKGILEAQARLQESEQWMEIAQEHLNAGRLLSPADDNAYLAYQKVLALNPEHTGAREGLKIIGDRLAAEARALLEQRAFDESLTRIDQALKAFPNHAALLALRKEVIAAREQAQALVKRIESLITTGAQQLAENRLTRPPGNNALETYRTVLALDPKEQRAIEGIDAIADRYQALAQDAADRKDYGKAIQMIARGLEIREHHGGLQSLQTSVKEALARQRQAAAEEAERKRRLEAARKAREQAERERRRREQELAAERKRRAEERARIAAEKRAKEQARALAAARAREAQARAQAQAAQQQASSPPPEDEKTERKTQVQVFGGF